MPISGMNLDRVASADVHAELILDTEDHQDHSFCGIMFDVSLRRNIPLEYAVVRSVWVRGCLGPMRVFAAQGSHLGKREQPGAWTQAFEAEVPASPTKLVELSLDEPRPRLRPGETVALYVHSSALSDESVVYDHKKQARLRRRFRSEHVALGPASAHLGPVPFSGEQAAPWSTWRYPREFVGRLDLGARFKLWTPAAHPVFPPQFQRAALALHLVARRRGLSGDVAKYVLNLCCFTWFDEAAYHPGGPVAAASTSNAATRRAFRQVGRRVHARRRAVKKAGLKRARAWLRAMRETTRLRSQGSTARVRFDLPA